ncbi:hypothetical protein C8R43DRAFT_1239656 [Mycena crocata]|nr:hypothetical protein C8R43DRAFT_1239656 [Mycena crocata]
MFEYITCTVPDRFSHHQTKMFHQGFVPVVLVSIIAGLKLYHMAWIAPPMAALFQGYMASCTYVESNPLRGFLCVVEPMFRQLTSNDVGKGLLTVFGTSGMVMSTYLYILSGRAGRSPYLSPLVIAGQTLLGQVLGAGFVGPITLPALFALVKTTELPNTTIAAPPPYEYTVTMLAMQFIVFMLSMGLSGVPSSSTTWPYINYAFQAFPLLFIPLAFLPRPPPALSTKVPTISATVFTVFKYFYTPMWWITVGQGANGYYRLGQGFSLPDYWMTLDFAGFVLTFFGMYAVDAVAGDAPASRSLAQLVMRMVLTGPPATMAAYYEAKEKAVIERVQRED